MSPWTIPKSIFLQQDGAWGPVPVLTRGWWGRSHLCKVFCNSLLSASPNHNYRHKTTLKFLYIYSHCLGAIAHFFYKEKWRLPFNRWKLIFKNYFRLLHISYQPNLTRIVYFLTPTKFCWVFKHKISKVDRIKWLTD